VAAIACENARVARMDVDVILVAFNAGNVP